MAMKSLEFWKWSLISNFSLFYMSSRDSVQIFPLPHNLLSGAHLCGAGDQAQGLTLLWQALYDQAVSSVLE